MKKQKRKKSPLYTGKEVHLGKISIEEAFKQALEPYFNKTSELNQKIS